MKHINFLIAICTMCITFGYAHAEPIAANGKTNNLTNLSAESAKTLVDRLESQFLKLTNNGSYSCVYQMSTQVNMPVMPYSLMSRKRVIIYHNTPGAPLQLRAETQQWKVSENNVNQSVASGLLIINGSTLTRVNSTSPDNTIVTIVKNYKSGLPAEINPYIRIRQEIISKSSIYTANERYKLLINNGSIRPAGNCPPGAPCAVKGGVSQESTLAVVIQIGDISKGEHVSKYWIDNALGLLLKTEDISATSKGGGSSVIQELTLNLDFASLIDSSFNYSPPAKAKVTELEWQSGTTY